MRKSTKISATLGVVAGLAVAFAPLAAFAESTELGTDKIQVTIETACTMEAEGYTAPSGEGASATTGSKFANTYKKKLEAGSYIDLTSADIDTTGGATAQATSINVKCNDSGIGDTSGAKHGWQIKAEGTVLTGQTTNKTIGLNDPKTDGSVSGWGVKLSKEGTGDITIMNGYDAATYKALTAGGVVVAQGKVSGGNNGDTLKIDGYRVSATASQEADVYEGTATYTFVAPQE